MTPVTPSQKPRRIWRWLIGIIVFLMIVAGGIYLAMIQLGVIASPIQKSPAPYPELAETRDGKWEQDLDYLTSQIVYLHPNAFFQTPQSVFGAKASALRANIPTLTDAEILTGMQELLAMLGDGHTRAYLQENEVFQTFPIGLEWFEDHLVVTSAHPDYQAAVGAKVIKIGEQDVLAAFAAVVPLISADNQQQVRRSSPVWLATPEALFSVGILPTSDSATYTFEQITGETFTLELKPASPAENAVPFVTIYDQTASEPPLRLQNFERNYWYTYLEDSQTVYFHYSRCNEDPAQPFAAFNTAMMAFIDANPVQRVVLDLRYNGGGNSSILRPFIEAIKARPSLNTETGVVVLIGRRTFSSAMMNALQLRDETNAQLIGEPTGGKPNGYGEVRTLRLPNSQLEIQYSTRFFRQIWDSDPAAVMPDLEIQMTWEDYLMGRDTILETALQIRTR